METPDCTPKSISFHLASLEDLSASFGGNKVDLERNESAETNESPFGSTLATPADGVVPREDPLDEVGKKLKDAGSKFGAIVSRKTGVSLSRGDISGSSQMSHGVPVNATQRSDQTGNSYETDHEDENDTTIRSSASLISAQIAFATERASSALGEGGPALKTQAHVENHFVDKYIDPLAFRLAEEPYAFLGFDSLKSSLNGTNVSNAIAFIPWCIAVGAHILMFPQHLDDVTFRSGLASPPSSNIRRFAYWSDVAVSHVLIFLAFLTILSVTVLNWTTSSMMFGVVFSQTIVAWSDFKVPKGRITLGKDDRLSVWLAMFRSDSFPEVTGWTEASNDGHVLSDPTEKLKAE